MSLLAIFKIKSKRECTTIYFKIIGVAMDRFRRKHLVLFSLVTTLLLTFSIAKSEPHAKKRALDAKEKLEAYIRFTQILNLIEKEYVDEVNSTELINKALKGLLSNLDAHSSYMDAKAFKELGVQTKGQFGGLGISIGMRDGALTVIAPIEGTPAHKAGLKSGDIILKINDKATLGMTIDESVNLMRGKPGTDVNLTIIRKGEPKPLKFNIVRDIIKIQSVYSKTIGDDILYLHITSFDQNVVDNIKKALKEHPNTKGIILDLRNNPGGLLDQAVGVVDLFVKEGTIVSQKGRNAKDNVTYKATLGEDIELPVVVLVNGGSASASEIVAGALQDHNRTVVVGEKTFGKGSVQVVLPAGKEDAIKLTVARYYLPSGRTIQNIGVTPDVIVHPGKIEYQKDTALIKERELKDHLESELEKLNKKSNHPNNSNATEGANNTKETKSKIVTDEQLYEDAQLKSAVDILRALILMQKGKQ